MIAAGGRQPKMPQSFPRVAKVMILYAALWSRVEGYVQRKVVVVDGWANRPSRGYYYWHV